MINQGLDTGLPQATSRIATDYLQTRHDTLGPVFLLGWHEGLTSVPFLKGHPVDSRGLSIFAVKLPLTLGKGRHRLPADFVKRTLVETDCTSLSSLLNRHFLWSGEEATWRFRLPPEYGPVRVRSLEITRVADSHDTRGTVRIEPRGGAVGQMDFLLHRGDRRVRLATTFPFVEKRRWSSVQHVHGRQHQYYQGSGTELPRMAVVVEVD